jgi:UDP-N-acetylglucosamine:LPS N-acetylglucosamine transferase
MGSEPDPVRAGRPRAVIVTASVGAGHDGAAHELARRLERDGFGVDVHDYLEILPRRLGRFLRSAYTRQLNTVPWTWGWVLAALDLIPPLAWITAAVAGLAGRRRLDQVLREAGPDVVVSTYPLASHVLGELRRRQLLAVPVITFLTDLSVHRLWICSGADAHLALHPVAAGQARMHGARAVVVTAPAVSRRFAPLAHPDRSTRRAALREAFGLPADAPVALVVAGSLGVGAVEEAVQDILATGKAVPLVVCGHNTALAARLDRVAGVVALGWVHDMAALVHASDVVVQNAGGLSSLEAISAGVPVITYRSIPGHGEANAAALEAAGLAPWIRSVGGLGAALDGALRYRSPGLPDAPEPEAVIAGLAAVAGGSRR